MEPDRNCEDHHLIYWIVRAISYVIAILVAFTCFCTAVLFSPFRVLVGFHLSKKYDQSIEFLDGLHTIFCMDNPTAPLHIQTYQIFSGQIDIARLRQRVNDRWLRREDNLKLRRILRKEFGYYFWLPNRNIQLENHVLPYVGSQPGNMKEFNAIASQLTASLSVEKYILWQIFLIDLPNDFAGYKSGPKCILCFNCHHSMGDGTMLTRFMADLADNPPDNSFVERKPPLPIADRVKYFAKMITTGPFLALKPGLVRERHQFLGPELSGVKLVSFSAPLALDVIAKIAENTETHMDVVLTSCVVGGLRAYFLSERIPVPSIMRFLRPMVLHGSPVFEKKEIMSKVSFACYNLPINATMPLDRLKLTKEMTDDCDNPSAYLSYLIITYCVNRIPSFLTAAMMNAVQTTGVIVHVNSVKEVVSLFGNEMIHSFVCASATGMSGMAIVSVTCNDVVTFGLKVDASIISDQDRLDKLIGFIVTELYDLERESAKYKRMSLRKD